MIAAQTGANIELDTAIADSRQHFTAANPASLARHQAAKQSLPGGNTRAVLYYDPFPLAMTGGEGNRLTDLDGHTYVDFVSEYTAGLYGHRNALIADAIRQVEIGRASCRERVLRLV